MLLGAYFIAASVLLIASQSSGSNTSTPNSQAAPSTARLLALQVRTVHTPTFPTTATVLRVVFGHTDYTVTSTPSPFFTPPSRRSAPTATTTPTTVATTPVTTPAPPVAPPAAPVAAPTPVTVVDSTATGLPPRGQATVWGCAAALAYLTAYAAPGFDLECPANAQGHEATTTCISEHSPCDMGRYIEIADPCPDAYMNEASNSWVLLGLADTPIDPFGYCG
jgi:hypothetical protein